MNTRVWIFIAVAAATQLAPASISAQQPPPASQQQTVANTNSAPKLPAAATSPAPGKPAESVTPTLTDVEKLTIANLLQRIELAQLKAQAAQTDFDLAREQVAKLVQSLQRDGFDLNLQTMTYSPKPKAEPEAAKNDAAPKKSGGGSPIARQ